MQNAQYSPAMMQFIDTVLHEKGIEGVEEDIVAQLRVDLAERLQSTINRAIVESLSAEQQKQFEHLIDTGKLNSLQSFLQEQGVDVNAIVARCMLQFRKNYLGA